MRFMRDLSHETQRLLRRFYKESQHHRVRQRAHCILLSFGGKTTTELMHIFAVERLTIYHWFDAWERHRFAGLYGHAKCGNLRIIGCISCPGRPQCRPRPCA